MMKDVNDRNMQQNNISIKPTDFIGNLSLSFIYWKYNVFVIDWQIYIAMIYTLEWKACEWRSWNIVDYRFIS